jgi:hypothetical protein
MRIFKYLLKILSSIPLNIHLNVGLLDHVVVQLLIPWSLSMSILLPIMTEPFHITFSSIQMFQFCQILVNTWWFFICDSGNTNACDLTFYCGCDLLFTGDYWCGRSSYKYLCAFFLEEKTIQLFCPFFNLIFFWWVLLVHKIFCI